MKKVSSASVLVICGFAMGCSESSPVSNPESRTERPTTITANRPITTELPPATAEPEDRTNAGVTLYDRDRKAKAPLDQPKKAEDTKNSR